MTPTAKKVVGFLAPALDQLGFDGTTGHSRGRHSGFWWKTPEGWRSIEISSVVAMLDSVLETILAEALEAEGEDAGLRLHLVEIVRRVVTGTSNAARGQFVAALRDSGEFNLSNADANAINAAGCRSRALTVASKPADRPGTPCGWSSAVVADHAGESQTRDKGRKGQGASLVSIETSIVRPAPGQQQGK
jgi:hypothetical protein